MKKVYSSGREYVLEKFLLMWCLEILIQTKNVNYCGVFFLSIHFEICSYNYDPLDEFFHLIGIS